MAKKKSTKKQQLPADILERAEILFKKKSFQAALREYNKFEKINKNEIIITDTVAEHMAVCRQETAVIRAGELVKKARRLLKKGDSVQARQYFEQAFDLTGDKQLAATIVGLQVASNDRDLLVSAGQAEAAGDYSAAAEILAKLQAACADNSLLCRRGRCLVMAGKWQQAAVIYGEADCSEIVDLYNYGFVLARQQKYLECLNTWQHIQSEHPDFTEQKEMVLTLLLQETEARLDEDPQGHADDIRLQIQSLTACEDSPAAMQLLSRCRSLQLVKLWQESRMEELVAMSDKSNHLNMTVLAIHARAAYIHMEVGGAKISAATVREFIDFWLCALFNSDSGKVSVLLLDCGLGLVRKYGGYHPETRKQLLSQWHKSLDLLTILGAIREDGNIEQAMPLFTPALALQTGICEDIFLLIRDNEEAFPDRVSFLTAGADYSQGAAALLMVRNLDYDGAFKFLDGADGDDLFVAHAVEMVLFACGLHALHHKDFKKAETLLITAIPLFIHSEESLKQMLAVLDMEDDWDDVRLTVCVNILSALQESCRSAEIDKALCRAMTRRAVTLFNSSEINAKILVNTLEKAALLNPEDEFTEFQLGDARRNLEMGELDRLIDRFKLSAASRLAAKSQYNEVRELYFEFIEEVCEQARHESDYQSAADLLLFKKFLKLAAHVDPLHPVVDMLKHETAQKEMWK